MIPKFVKNIHSRASSLTIILLCGFTLLIGQDTLTIDIGNKLDETGEGLLWTATVYSSETNNPAIGANIMSDDQVIAITDEGGQFELQLSPGKYSFSISALGFRDQPVILNAYTSGESRIDLLTEDILLEGVTVGAQSARERITEITPGLQRMTMTELNAQSKFFGEVDVLRSLQSMSGVHNVGEGASGFNVRGGNADQNLILQDGHLIFNPSHALGFFSLFHPDLIQYVDLYKGGIPAKYGGRLSSVLSVATREGNKENFEINGGIGVISSRLTMEGPIIKDKVSFIVAGRYSYADYIFNLVDNPNVNNSKALFNDITANINGRLSSTTNLGLSILNSQDDFQFGEEARFDYSTLSGEAYLKQLIGDKANVTVSVNKGRYTSSLFDLKGNDQSKFTNKIDYTRGKLDLLFAGSDVFRLSAGGEMTIYEVSPGEIEPFGGESIVAPETLAKEKGNELAGYLEAQLTIAERIDLSAGLRYTQFKSLGPDEVFQYAEDVIKSERAITNSIFYNDGETIASYTGLEPRLSMRYEVNDATSIKMGYSRTYQYLAQISNTASATPIDIWQLSNNHIEPQFSDNYSVGLFRNFNQNKFESSVEFFYRKAEGVIDYRDFADLLLNEHIETELVTGIGRAYGAEFNISKKLGNLIGDLSYTYSLSERQIEASPTQSGINNGSWYSSNYDIPHVLNINIVKNFAKSNLAFNFTYRSGRPTTAPVSSYANQNVLNIPIYSDRNKFRVPPFHRLDVSYTIGPWSKQNSNWNHSLTLSIYNLYFRKNAYSVYFRQNPFESVKAIRVATLGTLFPSITYNFSLK